MAGLLDPMRGDGSYVENRPSKGQLLWGIAEPYVMGPWNAWKGLMDADPETLLYDTGPKAQQAVENAFNVAGTVTGGSSVVPKPDDALNMGIKAFHGSPHDFDRFSLDKIGTGEGAQAYGHGLYFAGSEDTARYYRDALTRERGTHVWRDGGGAEVDVYSLAQKASADNPTTLAASFLQQEKSVDDALQFARSLPGDAFQGGVAERNAIIAGLEGFAKAGLKKEKAGRMYEVEINADPEQFLDWDKPLSEQPEAVRKGFGSLVDRDLSKETGWAKMSGQQALDAIMERYGSLDWPDNADATLRQQYRTNARSKASALLADKGIPGIKYLDAGSRVPSAMAKKELADWQAQLSVAERELADATARGDNWLISRKQAEVKRVQDGIARVAKEAEGTRNYVVFDDNLINIIRKYGIAGLLGGGAAMNAMTAQPQEQY